MPETARPIFGVEQRKALFRDAFASIFLQEPFPAPDPYIILQTPGLTLQGHVV